MTISKENRSYLRSIFYLAIPIIIQELFNASINMLDTFMIGSLGISEVTAVGLANEIFFLLIVLIYGINGGSAIFIGQFWGKGDLKSIHKTMGISLSLSMIAATTFALAALLIPEILISIYSDGDQRVIELGASYLRIAGISYFLFAISSCINCSHRNTGQTRLPMISTMVALSLSAGLNFVFIFIFDMSVEGAALATVIARIVEVSLQIALMVKLKSPILTSAKNYLAGNLKFFIEYIKVSFPVIINEVIWALGTTLYLVIYKYTGTEGQGAFILANNFQRLFLVTGLGIGTACAIQLSNLLGANEINRAISYSRKSLKLCALVSCIMSMILLAMIPLVIDFFNANEDVKVLVFRTCLVMSIFLVFKTLTFTLIIGILRSGGDTKACLYIDLSTVWFVGVPLTFIATYIFRLPIYWCVFFTGLEEVVKFTFLLKRALTNMWAKNLVKDM